MEKENWLNVKIEGFEDYIVSDSGNIIHKGRAIKPQKDACGYLHVRLYDKYSKSYKLVKMHRLVYTTFNDIKNNKNVINHINGIKDDNRLLNLEEVTKRDNSRPDKCIVNRKKTSKYCGVSKRGNRWIAQIQINNINTYLGMFKYEEEAYNAYINKLNEINK